MYNVSGGQHADFDGVDREVAQNRVQLGGHHPRGYRVNLVNSLTVLDGEGRRHGEAVGSEKRRGLQVLLEAGPGPRVGAGDYQDGFHAILLP
jgi:hypothetical protein